MAMTGDSPGKAALISAAFCLLGTACATPDHFGGSRQRVIEWSTPRGFVAATIKTESFDILELKRIQGNTKRLTVYIEGDGAAWPTPYHPPRNPTPSYPVALALAASDPSQAVVYLGRPCQYLDEAQLAQCPAIWWTNQRFSSEVIKAYAQALDSIKIQSGAQTLRLVGYSGGGVIAALTALGRDDVDSLVTVASPLSLGKWTQLKSLSPLSGSIDPLFALGKLPPATHWIGTRDDVVPLSIVEEFAQKRGGKVNPIKGYDHQCCWTENWPRLLKEEAP